jgi:hypothetical protein
MLLDDAPNDVILPTSQAPINMLTRTAYTHHNFRLSSRTRQGLFSPDNRLNFYAKCATNLPSPGPENKF